MNLEQHNSLCETYWDIWSQCQADPEYTRLFTELIRLESRYDAILAALPESQRQTIDRCFTLRESMNRRMLEFACEQMLNPKEEP